MDGAVVAEVNPTVGMAWLVQQVEDTTKIPSRKKPKAVYGKRFRAKSDFYWALGANARIAKALACQALEGVEDHEHEAALYALAVASSILHPRQGVAETFWIGKQTGQRAGVYHLLGPIHQSWAAERRRIQEELCR
jgi:hypothetical protein